MRTLTAIYLVFLAVFAPDSQAQIGHPKLMLDAGYEVYLLDADLKLRSEPDAVHNERSKRIRGWLNDGTILKIDYGDRRSEIYMGARFPKSQEEMRKVAEVVASYARRITVTSRYVHIYDTAGRRRYVYSLEANALTRSSYE